MKRCSWVLLSVGALALATLPVLPGCESVTETAGQNSNKIARVVHIDTLQITDDMDEIFLVDRPSWLSHKPMPDY